MGAEARSQYCTRRGVPLSCGYLPANEKDNILASVHPRYVLPTFLVAGTPTEPIGVRLKF